MKDIPIEQILHIDFTRLHAYSTGLLQGKAYQRLYTHLTKTLLQFDISVPEWKLLGQLHENGAMRLAHLADFLSYDPPMVTKLTKNLEKKGLIVRTYDKMDERAKVIAITKSGNTLINDAEPEVKKTMAGLLRGVTQDELITYLKVLITIVNNTQE